MKLQARDSENSWRLQQQRRRRESLMKLIFISSFGAKKKSLHWSHMQELLTRTTGDLLLLWPSLVSRSVTQQEICVSLNLFTQNWWTDHSFWSHFRWRERDDSFKIIEKIIDVRCSNACEQVGFASHSAVLGLFAMRDWLVIKRIFFEPVIFCILECASDISCDTNTVAWIIFKFWDYSCVAQKCIRPKVGRLLNYRKYALPFYHRQLSRDNKKLRAYFIHSCDTWNSNL